MADTVKDTIACLHQAVSAPPLEALLVKAALLLEQQEAQIAHLNRWIDDYQKENCIIRCAFCGWAYGERDEDEDELPREALAEHVRNCPNHPYAAVLQDREMALREKEELAKQLAASLDRERRMRGTIEKYAMEMDDGRGK